MANSVLASEGLSTDWGTLVVCLALVPVTYFVYLAFVKARRLSKVLGAVKSLPGPDRHWLYGNLHQISTADEKGLTFLVKQTNKHKSYFALFGGPFWSVVVCAHPDSMKELLRTTEPKQLDGTYAFLIPWLGDGLLLSSGNKWFRNRRLLTPAFHFDVLKPYMKIYNEATDIFLAKLLESSRSGSVEICRPVTLLTLNVILRCACSSDVDVQRQGESHPYVNAVIGLARLLTKRTFNPLLFNPYIYALTKEGRLNKKYLDLVHKMSEDVISRRKETLKENPGEAQKRYLDFLDILLLARDENDQGLTDGEIRDEVDTFLFEGHDTTSSAISWLLYDMARNPDHQQTCRQEIDQFMAKKDTPHVEWADLTEMPFTTQCIRETLRLHAPVPFIGRQTTKELKLGGHVLPPGSLIDLGIYLANHNEDVWGEDHMEFKPERFNTENAERMDSFAFVPFSAGPRNCIGQNFAMHEIKVVLSKVLHRFTLSVDEDHHIEHLAEVVMRAANGIKIYVQPRP